MYVDNIRQSSERMREMLNTLLDFFRLDNGKEQPNLSPCRISAITHILETEFMPIAMNKGLTLIVESHTDAVVLTDKERILQIGNNLLSNAIKFTDNGSVSLAADYDNGLLKLIVEDTGTGMTEDEQQRVFGAFERLSNAAAKDGFGLGLSIVQRIVAMLGGTIRLESEKGKGSRFTVEIPMQTAEELPEQTIQAQMRHNHICHDVIAIDNDEVLLLMLKEMYAHEGMHCDTCTNVSVLMELIRKKEYSLLLTDLNMPEISGFELLELLRSSNVGNSKSIPIVVTTASGSCSKEELIGRGFAGCLFKPFSISELMEITDKCAFTIGKTKRRVGEKRNVGKSEKRNVVKIKTKRSEILTRDAKINTKKKHHQRGNASFFCVLIRLITADHKSRIKSNCEAHEAVKRRIISTSLDAAQSRIRNPGQRVEIFKCQTFRKPGGFNILAKLFACDNLKRHGGVVKQTR